MTDRFTGMRDRDQDDAFESALDDDATGFAVGGISHLVTVINLKSVDAADEVAASATVPARRGR